MVFFAVLVLPESPAEVMYWIPPTMMKMTATTASRPMTPLTIPVMAEGSSSVLPLQPLALRTSSGRSLEQAS